VPSALALGDFTNDSVLDLLVANESQGTVAFHLGSANGPPWAAAGPPVDGGDAPVAIVPADVNRDGKLDAIVVDEGLSGQGALTILIGNGDGTFTAGGSVATGLFSADAAVGNFDNDLFPDVAVVNAGGNSVTILRNNGSGGFTIAQTKSVGAGPTSIAAGLLNGDDRLDLAVANEDGDTVSVLLGRGGAMFDDAQSYLAGSDGSSPVGVSLADVNGDGRLDVLTANAVSSDVSVLLGDGQGGLGRARAFVSDEQPEAIGTGDLNGDGLGDAVTVNNGPPNVAALLAVADSGGALAGIEDVFTLQNPMVLTAADADNNGVADLIVGPSTGGTGALQVSFAQPAGGFTAPLGLTVPGGSAGVVHGDFDGVGAADIAVANKDTNNVSVLLSEGIARFGAAVNTDIAPGAAGMTVGDWNMDGRSDLAVVRQVGDANGGVVILLASGRGTFATAAPLTTGPAPTGIDTGDFNNDGRLDLVVANQGDNTFSVWLGAGNGTFAAPTSVAVTGGPRAVAVGDFDRDGFDDVAMITQLPEPRLRLYYGNGAGAFTAGQAAALPSQGVGAALVARDFTGDSIADLLVADQVNNSAVLFVVPANRAPIRTRDIQAYPISRGPMATAAGDVNGDGTYDGAVANLLVASTSVLTNIRATPALRGDGNTDGRVTAADLVAVFRELPENPTGRVEVIDRGPYKPGAGIDANGDGLVTAQDTAGTIAWTFEAF